MLILNAMELIFWFALGVIFGSTANALIDRIPKGIAWTSGRSKCDHCGHVLAWYDLVPLLSFVLLRGKCRYCGERIPLRNFLLELALGLGLVWLQSWTLAVILWITVTIAVMDWETQLVSELLVAIWALTVVIHIVNMSAINIPNMILGVVAGLGVIGGLWAITRGRGMGFGDVEIALVLGAWLGWPNIAIGLEIAFISGAVVGIWQIITGKNKIKGHIAFGTFLIFGGWIAFVWGDTILKALYG